MTTYLILILLVAFLIMLFQYKPYANKKQSINTGEKQNLSPFVEKKMETYFETKRYDEIISGIENYKNLTPRSYEILSDTYLKLGNREKSIKMLEEIFIQFDKSFSLNQIFKLADYKIIDEDYKGAIQLFQKLKLDEWKNIGDYGDLEYAYKYGWCYYQLNEYQLALEILKIINEENAINEGIDEKLFNLMADCHIGLGENKKAIQVLNKILLTNYNDETLDKIKSLG